MTTHDLKTNATYFDAITSGAKTFELRRNDRGYQVGDALRLMRTTGDRFTDGCTDFDCKDCHSAEDFVTKFVTYVFSGDPSLRDCGGLVPGYVVLGLGDA